MVARNKKPTHNFDIFQSLFALDFQLCQVRYGKEIIVETVI